MYRVRLRRLAVCVAACAVMPAYAQTSGFTGEAALSSQLIDRGVAMTPVTPILQGAASWSSNNGWSLGLAASTQLRAPGRMTEALAHVAHYWTLSDNWQMQAGVLYYSYTGTAYTGATHASLFDRVETGVGWMYRDVLNIGLSAIRLTGSRDDQLRGAADLDAHWPLPGHFSLSAGAGVTQSLTPGAYYQTGYGYRYERGGSYYGYGHTGVIWSRGMWQVELDRVATTPVMRQPGLSPATWMATVSRSF